MKNETPNFFDTTTILAIALVAMTFLGWQWHMQNKYPDAYKKKAVAVEGQKSVKPLPDPASAKDSPVESTGGDKSPGLANSETVVESEKLYHFNSEDVAFDISSRGMGFKNFQIKKYKDRKGETIHLGFSGEAALPFETRLLGHSEALSFDVKQVNDRLFIGRAKVGELEITKTVEIQPEIYLIKQKVAVTGSDDRFVGLVQRASAADGGLHLLDHGAGPDHFRRQ